MESRSKNRIHKNTLSFFYPDCTVAVGVSPTHARLFIELEEYTSDCDLHTNPEGTIQTILQIRIRFCNTILFWIQLNLMQFESTHVSGKGRGKPMGFPTINLKIPENFELKNGIYAVKVIIEDKVFKGALHYGPVPTFGELQKSLEIYLIEITNADLINYGLENLDDKIIKVEIIKYLRDIIKFKLVEELVRQIEEDVRNIQKI